MNLAKRLRSVTLLSVVWLLLAACSVSTTSASSIEAPPPTAAHPDATPTPEPTVEALEAAAQGEPFLDVEPALQFELSEDREDAYAHEFAAFDRDDVDDIIVWLRDQGGTDRVNRAIQFAADYNNFVVLAITPSCEAEDLTLSVWPRLIELAPASDEQLECAEGDVTASAFVVPRVRLTERGMLAFSPSNPPAWVATGQPLASTPPRPRPDSSIMPLQVATEVDVQGVAYSRADAQRFFANMDIAAELDFVDFDSFFIVAASTGTCYPQDAWLEIDGGRLTYLAWRMALCEQAVDVSAIFVVPLEHPDLGSAPAQSIEVVEA